VRTARFLGALIIGTALVFAVPWATADPPPAEPDGTEAVGPDTTAPTAALTPKPTPQAATAPLPKPAPGHGSGSKPDPGGGQKSKPKAEPGSDPKPEPEPGSAPKAEPGSDPKPKPNPEPGSDPKPKPNPEPGSDPKPKPNPEPGSDPKPKPNPEPGSDPKPKPTPQPGSNPKPKPIPQPGTGPKPKPGTGPGSGAPPQPPSSPPATGNPSGDCFLTSAGLACRGNPPCVVTTSGVTCGTNCIVTSAGLTCPPRGGYVRPRGVLISGEPVPGGPKQRTRTCAANPTQEVSEATVSGGPERTPTCAANPTQEVRGTTAMGGQVQDDSDRQSPDGGPLPFTGAALLPWLALACGLLASGLLVRRLTSTTGATVEPPGEARALPGQPRASRRTRAQPSRGAIVLQSLALVVCGVLLRLRIRR
jgi:hypothetical protein